MTFIILSIVGGLVGLAVGGELLVRGAVGISLRAGLSHLVTGVVIVGAATSMPEMVASVQAALIGSPEIAWGNIVGSNIANSLLILGGAAVVAPIVLSGAGKRDAISGLVATLLLGAIGFAALGAVWIGFALLGLLAAYIYWRVRHPSKAHDYEEEEEGAPDNLLVAIVLFVLGVAALVIGGKYLVDGAIDVARLFAIPETVIGLTIVADRHFTAGTCRQRGRCAEGQVGPRAGQCRGFEHFQSAADRRGDDGDHPARNPDGTDGYRMAGAHCDIGDAGAAVPVCAHHRPRTWRSAVAGFCGQYGIFVRLIATRVFPATPHHIESPNP